MRIAVRRFRTSGDSESPRTIALAKPGTVAPFLRRPARRLSAAHDVPALSRIVLRPLTLR